MMGWWNSLEPLNQWFYGAAFFFSAIFLWQFISSMIGMGGEADVDLGVDADIDVEGIDLDDIEAHSLEEAAETTAAFKLLSLRAILAFLTLFTWAGAMYLNAGKDTGAALTYAVLWGAAGWVIVALLVNWMRKLAETGTPRLATCVGRRGLVYLDIPADGQGEVRVLVSGSVSHVKARAVGGEGLKAGTAARVVRVLDQTTIEVEPAQTNQAEAGNQQ